MGKSFVLFSLSFILLTSVLAPSVCMLMNWDIEQVVLNDFAEEEPNKMDKEGFENDIFLLKLPKFEISNSNELNLLNTYYQENASMHAAEIVIPPPELQS